MEEKDAELSRRVKIRKPKSLTEKITDGLGNYLINPIRNKIDIRLQKVRDSKVWSWIANKIDKWDWEDTWAAFAMAFLIIVVSILYNILMTDKKVQCYYVETSWSNEIVDNKNVSLPVYYINGYIPWAHDKASFITRDRNEALQLLAQLPQCTPKAYPIKTQNN
jgi:hypothetical protein